MPAAAHSPRRGSAAQTLGFRPGSPFLANNWTWVAPAGGAALGFIGGNVLLGPIGGLAGAVAGFLLARRLH